MAGGIFSEKMPIHVTGRIQVATNDISQDGEILIVAKYDGLMLMKTPQGWKSWNDQLDSLTAAEPSRTLNAIEDIQISTNLTLPGDFSIFIG